MTRILDLDLDFFLHGAVHHAGRGDERPDAEYCPPWNPDELIRFLEGPCGLSGPLPGLVVTHHGELFPIWRRAINAGRFEAPFHVTHIDAHADIGLGDAGFVQIVTDLLHRPPEDRLHPHSNRYGLGDGNWLAFAVACRWVGEMVYVYNDDGGDDILALHMEGFDPDAQNLQLKAISKEEYERNTFSLPDAHIDHYEPLVPLRSVAWREFRSEGPYDVICLAQSPPFTPPQADELFQLIRERYVDEHALADVAE